MMYVGMVSVPTHWEVLLVPVNQASLLVLAKSVKVCQATLFNAEIQLIRPSLKPSNCGLNSITISKLH